MTRPNRRTPKRVSGPRLQIEVSGYKALRAPVSIGFSPLTVISGTNSSGKTSFMQSILLLKQTLEAQFDPGPILMNGPNVALTSTRQLFSRGKAKDDIAKEFRIRIQSSGEVVALTFERQAAPGITLKQMDFAEDGAEMTSIRIGQTYGPDSTPADVQYYISAMSRVIAKENKRSGADEAVEVQVQVIRDRCFLGYRAQVGRSNFTLPTTQPSQTRKLLLETVHVPGLRGNPERFYPRSAVGRLFPGTFEDYVASLIDTWQNSNRVQDKDRLSQLNSHLSRLGLTWKVHARSIDDTNVELLVGRMPHAQQGGAHDLVSIADVGFGVSQVLPVLVALVAARPGQLVFLEQPEIHLHPRAQSLLAEVIAQHSKRGVVVVVETHSSLIIRGIQTAVARNLISSKSVSLNWFGRDPQTGVTSVSSSELDAAGRFGDWPLDFDDVAMEAEMDYLSAAEARLSE